MTCEEKRVLVSLRLGHIFSLYGFNRHVAIKIFNRTFRYVDFRPGCLRTQLRVSSEAI